MLLDAPINATWAANHGATWRDKGFSGFLFEGLVDNIEPYPSERIPAEGKTTSTIVQEHIIPGDWEALIVEITAAVNRLKAEGLDHNFLRLTLLPEVAYFTDAHYQEIAKNRLYLAGECCRRTGLRGIALDTQSQSALYDFRWAGHPLNIPPDSLSAKARQSGSSLLRSFLRACPEGEVLLLAQSPEDAPPLWFSFFEGALESVGAAAAIPIRLVRYDDGMPQAVTSYRNLSKHFDILFKKKVSATAYALWKRQCGLSHSLRPIEYEGDIPTARSPIEQYRRALYAAALYGKDYTIIHAPAGSWWHIPPDVAAQFEHLRQGGRARVTFAPPVPATVDAYAPRLLISDMVHLGSLQKNGQSLEVLQKDKGSALLAWDGLTQELRIATRTEMLSETNLVTGGVTFHTPNNEEIVVPPHSGTLLFTGLPARTFALPAALQMKMLSPLQAGITRAEMEVMLYNPLELPLRGTLTLNTADHYSLGAAAIDVTIGAYQSETFRKTIQGISMLGQRPVFSMNLYVAAEPPVMRTFSFPVEPPEVFHICMEGPVQGSPIILAEEDNEPLLIFSDARGTLVCFETSTRKERWRIRVRGTYSQPPLLLQDSIGEPFVVLQNEHGRCRFFNISGEEKVTLYPPINMPLKMTTMTDRETGSIHLVTASTNGTICIYTPAGLLTHRFESQSHIRYLASAPTLPGYLFVVGADATVDRSTPQQDSPSSLTLSAYNPSGELLWQRRLPHATTCPPEIYASGSSFPTALCINDAAGNLYCLNGQDGSLLAEYSEDASHKATHLLAFPGAGSDTFMLAKADAAALTLYTVHNAEMIERWSQPLNSISTLSPLPNRAGIVAGMRDGSVYAYNSDGGLLWEDQQNAGMITGLKFYETQPNSKAHIAVVSSNTGLIRGVEIVTAGILSGSS